MVVQEDDFGCGVACVANLLNISYKQTLYLFDQPNKSRTEGFWCREIVAALRNAGIDSKCKYVSPRARYQIYQSGTIVYIARDKKHPTGHYLLRKNNLWLDPWINFPELPRMAGLRNRLFGNPIYAIFTIQ